MKRLLGSILAAGMVLAPLGVPQMVESSWGQTQNSQRQKVDQLLKQAKKREQPLQAIKTYQQALAISRQLKYRESEAKALLGLGDKYDTIGQRQQALNYYNQALPIFKAVGDKVGEAITLNNIGGVYGSIGLPHKALEYYNQALPIYRAVGNKAEEATTLNNIGWVYTIIGQPYKALEYYNQSLPIFRAVGDEALEAVMLNNIGGVYGSIGQPHKALEYYNQALFIFRAVDDKAEEATTLNNIGEVYRRIGQPHKALNYYNQALPIYRAVSDKRGEARTLNNIGLVYRSIGQPHKALEYYNQALPVSKAVDDKAGEAVMLNSIAAVYGSIGQRQKALEYYNQSLPIFRAVDDKAGEATTLNNIGWVYDSIGQRQKALEYYNQALPILRAVDDKAGEATTLDNIGEVYRSIGQPHKALNYYNQALPISKAVDDKAGKATTLNYIGLIYDDIGQPHKALNYYNQALLIHRAVDNKAGEAITLNNIAGVYDSIGQRQKTLNYYNQALPISRAVSDKAGEATTLNNIGFVYSSIGQQQKALNYYNQALPIFRAVGDKAGEAKTLNNIAFVYRDTKRPTDAIKLFEDAVKITLKTRGDLKRENRQKFLQREAGRVLALVDLLIDQNQPDKAYEWVNLASTAELADYTRLINAKVENPNAQKAIEDWNQKNQQLQLLDQQLQQNFSVERSRQMRELEAQVNKQAEDISRNFPEVAELFETTPTDIDKLKKNIPTGTVIVHPVLITSVSDVPNNVAIFVLSKDKLTVTKKTVNAAEINKLLTQYRQQLENYRDPNFLTTSQKLYDILLRPVEHEIQSSSPTQLSIIATDKLRYLPFETLYDGKNYLIEKYPVNYLTRISARSWQNPSLTSPTAFLQKIPFISVIAGVVIIGSIGFLTFRQFRLVAASVLVILSGGVAFWLLTSGSTVRVLALGNPRPVEPFALNGAEEEVKGISKILPGSEFYIRQNATLDKFKIQSPRFQFLHLATHGCFEPLGCCLPGSKDCQQPNKVDMEPNTILFANTQFKIADAALLGLQNTELLTLSACQTAREADSSGQTISGVAYVFERAGAKAVIASLWSAEDNTTKAIMTQFYENLKKGMTKGEALRQAKLSQINNHPFFWSPLILIGDAR